MHASAMVFAGGYWSGQGPRSTGYNVPLDDGFLCRQASPGGWCW